MIDSTQTRAFPFKSVLSLNLLIEYWEKAIKSGAVPFGEPLLKHIHGAPELKEPISDLSVLEKHRDLIDYLMSAVIAPAHTDNELAAATIPYQFVSFFESQSFRKTLDLDQIDKSEIIIIPGNYIVVGKTIQACLLILHQFYNVKINFDKPILFTIRNPVNGLD